jgi:hypothetical protein
MPSYYNPEVTDHSAITQEFVMMSTVHGILAHAGYNTCNYTGLDIQTKSASQSVGTVGPLKFKCGSALLN